MALGKNTPMPKHTPAEKKALLQVCLFKQAAMFRNSLYAVWKNLFWKVNTILAGEEVKDTD